MVKVGAHQLRAEVGKGNHKGNPSDAYDNDDEYPITDREYLKIARMAVAHRFPISDDEKRAAVIAALKRLASKSDRVAMSAARVIVAMEAINQIDDRSEDEPLVIETTENHLHIEGTAAPTLSEILDGLDQHPDFAEVAAKRLADGDTSEHGKNGNGRNGNGNGHG
jgi:hypothetical protein